jgi:CO/xanthine dehydrogenase Mo-binding subunit
VKINMLYAGGSFGRRANTHSDYVVEAAQIVKAIGGKAPVKLVWMREDDMRGGYYRPLFHHALEAALDAGGTAHRLAAPAGRPVDPARLAVRVDDGQGRDRRRLG